MKRDELLSRLEQSMMSIGKEMYHEQVNTSICSPAQTHVLMVLGAHGTISVKQLAEKLRVTSSAATQHVDALEKAGLLSRKPGANDRREVEVEITRKGKNALKKARAAKTQMLDTLFGALDDDELHTLVGLVEKVTQNYISNKESYRAEV